MSNVRRVDKFPTLPYQFDDNYRRKLQEILREHALVVDDAQQGLKWDDLRFPAQAVRVGGVGNATADTDGTLIFAGNADQAIQMVAQMPHAWAAEASGVIRPHVHLRFKTSNSGKNTRWKLTWDAANVNGDFGATTGNNTITVANPANVNKHVIAAFAEIDMTGFKDSCILLLTLTRLASSDAADDDTNAANLLEFDIHYQSDGRGSEQEYPV